MKKKFKVIFTKVHVYEVEAETMDEAEDIAFDLDADKTEDLSWIMDPVDKIEIEEIE